MDLNGGKKVLSRHYMKSELTLIAVKAEGSGHLCEKKKMYEWEGIGKAERRWWESPQACFYRESFLSNTSNQKAKIAGGSAVNQNI